MDFIYLFSAKSITILKENNFEISWLFAFLNDGDDIDADARNYDPRINDRKKIRQKVSQN